MRSREKTVFLILVVFSSALISSVSLPVFADSGTYGKPFESVKDQILKEEPSPQESERKEETPAPATAARPTEMPPSAQQPRPAQAPQPGVKVLTPAEVKTIKTEPATEVSKVTQKVSEETITRTMPSHFKSLQSLIKDAKKNIKTLDQEIHNRETETDIRSHYDKGQALRQEGKLEEAKQEMKKVVELSSDSKFKRYIRKSDRRRRIQAKEEAEREKQRAEEKRQREMEKQRRAEEKARIAAERKARKEQEKAEREKRKAEEKRQRALEKERRAKRQDRMSSPAPSRKSMEEKAEREKQRAEEKRQREMEKQRRAEEKARIAAERAARKEKEKAEREKRKAEEKAKREAAKRAKKQAIENKKMQEEREKARIVSEKEQEILVHHNKGNQLYEQGDYEGARVEWDKALKISEEPIMAEHFKKLKKQKK